MAKFYQAEKEINGIKYVAQFNGISAGLEAIDRSYIDGTNNTSMVKMANYLLENVIVEPKGLTPDSFDSVDEFNSVLTFAREVMQGQFRNQKNETGTKGTSK